MQAYYKMPKNFMTPNVLKVEQYGEKIYELSQGEALGSSEIIYGVSEFEKGDTRFGLQGTEKSQMFTNLKEAKKYYSLIKLQ